MEQKKTIFKVITLKLSLFWILEFLDSSVAKSCLSWDVYLQNWLWEGNYGDQIMQVLMNCSGEEISNNGRHTWRG